MNCLHKVPSTAFMRRVLRLTSFVGGALMASAAGVLLLGAEGPPLRFLGHYLAPLSSEIDLAPSASPIMTDRNGIPIHMLLNDADHWQFPLCLDAISPHLAQATLAVEDKRFFTHPGVDVRAIVRAFRDNLLARRTVSGASTLTMQLVKQHTPPTQGLPGKLRQAGRALGLEHRVDKAAILTAYLNTAPYGGNLLGAEAAARRYFGKGARELTLPEAALLAGLPKSPTALHPLRYPDRARRRRDHVLRRMFDEGMIGEEVHAQARQHPLAVAWHDYPALAPHLAIAQRERARSRGHVRLTLDAPLQTRLETQVKRYLRQFDHEITNAAVMVVETQTGAVLARVGSADFNDATIQGQVDLCRAPRAPGSALKPFVYALAMERQRLYPTEVLLDNTLDYGVYNPGNFDGAFNGLVTAGEALRWSLNIPAVTVLDRIGVGETLAFLEGLGFDTLQRKPEEYGLGLVLGNCELRLESLVCAYGALARLGLYQPLHVLADAPPVAAPLRILSEGVALALWYMLEQPFPAEPWTDQVRVGGRETRLCWKTGTSTGGCDAWSVAFNNHYVVGVWLGNNDGRPSERLIGAHAALPLTASVFRSLPVPATPAFPQPERRLSEVEVCAASGLPKTPWCPVGRMVRLPREQYLHRRCDMHRPDGNGAVAVHWPASSRDWDLAAVPGVVPAARPALHNQNQGTTSRRPLVISTPVENASYVISGTATEERIQLETSAPVPEGLHWYYNGRYLGRSQPMQPLFLPLSPGRHHVSCMTDSGETAAVSFRVLPG